MKLHILASAALMAFRSMPLFYTWRTTVVTLIAAPVALTLFYASIATGGGATAMRHENAIAAAAGVGSVAASVAVSSLIAYDRFNGTLPFLMIAPFARAQAWIGRYLAVVFVGLVMAGVGAVSSIMLIGPGLGLEQWLAVGLILFSACLGSVGLGFALGAVSLRIRDSLLLANIAEFLLPIGAGVVAPISVLPWGLDRIATIIPLAHATEAGREMLAVGISGTFWLHIGLVYAVGGIWLLVGLLLWITFERRARSLGNIEALSIG